MGEQMTTDLKQYELIARVHIEKIRSILGIDKKYDIMYDFTGNLDGRFGECNFEIKNNSGLIIINTEHCKTFEELINTLFHEHLHILKWDSDFLVEAFLEDNIVDVYTSFMEREVDQIANAFTNMYIGNLNKSKIIEKNDAIKWGKIYE